MRSALLVLLIAALGCTDQTPEAPPRPQPNNGGGSGGNGSRRDGGPDASQEDLLAPKVELLAPSPSSDPNSDEILTDANVTVKCHAAESRLRGGRNVDPSTVRISAESSVDPMKRVMGVVTSAGEEDFEAELVLEDFPNGGVQFVCSASDTGTPAKTTTAVVESLLDLGPTVRILSPKDDSTHALKNAVAVQFEVLPAPVTEDDEGAEVSSINFRVLDREFEFEEDPEHAGRYTVSIPFYDTEIFQMAPRNADIVVTAYNSRRPNAVERRSAVRVDLDSSGPTIVIESPGNRQIVRGQIQLVVKITDPSGILKSSVIGRINMGRYLLDDWEITGDTYVAQFDTRAAIFEDLPDITIDVSANDMVGNDSMVSRQLLLDNVPPVISIDPPLMREYYDESATVRRCSRAFDPLGDAASDGEDVQRAVMFRALVNERTNSIAGGNVRYVAGVDEASMKLYARHDDGIPLLIDTDADGKCDDINSEMLEDEERPAFVPLSPMEIRGSAEYTPDTTFDDANHTPMPADDWRCVAGTAPPPEELCASDMTRVVHQTVEGKFKAVYSLSPAQGNGLACNGNTWTLEPIVGEGWTCVAALVFDNIGNRGISRPIRVCIDDGTDPPPSCHDKVANPPPSCVEDCTLPDDFEPHRMLKLQP